MWQVHCGRTGCLDDDDVPPPLRVPTFDEQDHALSWLDGVARALAWQHAAAATWGSVSVRRSSGGGGGSGSSGGGGGTRLRASLFQGQLWPQLREVGCVCLDSFTLQCHAYLAELQRLDPSGTGPPGGG